MRLSFFNFPPTQGDLFVLLAHVQPNILYPAFVYDCSCAYNARFVPPGKDHFSLRLLNSVSSFATTKKHRCKQNYVSIMLFKVITFCCTLFHSCTDGIDNRNWQTLVRWTSKREVHLWCQSQPTCPSLHMGQVSISQTLTWKHPNQIRFLGSLCEKIGGNAQRFY